MPAPRTDYRARRRAYLEVLAKALQAVRLQAGYRSIRKASAAVEDRTGEWINPSSISSWERGDTIPNHERLVTYLIGIDSSAAALDQEIRRLTAQPLVIDLAAQLRANPDIRDRLVHFVEKAAPEGPESAQLLELLNRSITGMENGED